MVRHPDPVLQRPVWTLNVANMLIWITKIDPTLKFFLCLQFNAFKLIIKVEKINADASLLIVVDNLTHTL